ncbi:hypothetical protein ACFL0K_01350 [Patescibacteria group bacterium]
MVEEQKDSGVFLVDEFNHFTPHSVCIDPNPTRLTTEMLGRFAVTGGDWSEKRMHRNVLSALLCLDKFRIEISLSVDLEHKKLTPSVVWGTISFGGVEILRFCKDGLYMLSQWPQMIGVYDLDPTQMSVDDWRDFFAQGLQKEIDKRAAVASKTKKQSIDLLDTLFGAQTALKPGLEEEET